MEETSNFWNIAFAVYMVVGAAAIVKVVLDIASKRSDDQDVYKVPEPNPHEFKFEEEMYHQGYVFCNVFKTADILSIAHEMGVALTKEDVIKVVSSIKKDFTIRVGIDRHRIEMYIRVILKRNNQKQ